MQQVHQALHRRIDCPQKGAWIWNFFLHCAACSGDLSLPAHPFSAPAKHGKGPGSGPLRRIQKGSKRRRKPLFRPDDRPFRHHRHRKHRGGGRSPHCWRPGGPGVDGAFLPAGPGHQVFRVFSLREIPPPGPTGRLGRWTQVCHGNLPGPPRQTLGAALFPLGSAGGPERWELRPVQRHLPCWWAP